MLDEVILKCEIKQENLNNSIKKLNKKIEKLNILNEANSFLLSFSDMLRQSIIGKLENIVNYALKGVFDDKNIEFTIISQQDKRLKYELYVRTNGILTGLFKEKGGGVLDIITLSLRIGYLSILKSHLRQVLLLDEPFKNLDKIRLPKAIKWLKELQKMLNIQFIIITHIEDLIEDKEIKTFNVKQINGISKVK